MGMRLPDPSPFTTAVLCGLLSTAPVPTAAQSSDPPDVEVRCHVFQTARDAPVVPGKRTVVRVYANWTEEPDPGSGREAQSPLVRSTVRIRAGQTDLPPTEKWFWRPDWHLRDDSVTAEISANHYGWRPPPGDGQTPIPVRAVVEFESEETGKIHEYDGACPVVGLPSAPTLKIDYYMIKVEGWYHENWEDETWESIQRIAEEAPYGSAWEGEWEWVKREAHHLMEGSMPFALRNLPVGSIEWRYAGVLAYNRWLGRATPWNVARALYPRAVRANPEVDVIVGIVPPELDPDDEWIGVMQPLNTPSGEHFSARPGHRRVAFLELDPLNPPRQFTTLTHEIGHFYGLCHTLPVRFEEAPPAPGPRASIPRSLENDCVPGRMENEGFNLVPNLERSSNKSETEGNGEEPDLELVPVVPVMDSGSVFDESRSSVRFMTNEHYERLIRTLGWLGFYDRAAGGPDRDAGAAPSPGPGLGAGVPMSGPSAPAGAAFLPGAPTAPGPGRQTAARYMVVSGIVPPTGETVHLDPVRILELPEAPEMEPGDYRLDLRDPEGRVLESISFAPGDGRASHGESTGVRGFRIGVPVREDLAEVVVRRGEAVLTRRARSASPPTLSVGTPGAGETWDGGSPVRWSATDPDGDTLAFDVYYSPDGERWSPLAVAVPDTELAWLAPGDLEAGPSPRLRVVALDGFRSAEAEARFNLEGGFRFLASTPGPGDTVVAPAAIELGFNREVDPGSLPRVAVELRDSDGESWPAGLELDGAGRTARLVPDTPLRQGASYEVLVGGEVADRFGNSLGREVRWSFHTEPDRRRPRVLATEPMPGALGVAPEGGVLVHFDEPMDPATLGSPALRVEEADTGEPAPGGWSWDAETRTARFTPRDPLTRRATYRVVVEEGVTDEAGNPVRPPDSWTFRVAGLIRPRGP